MDRKLFFALALLTVCGSSFASNIHIAAYRIDPSPHPSQDFSLYLTFQNDLDLPVDNIRVSLACPAGLGCVNETISLSPHEMTEVRFPITSGEPAGVYLITASWQDGSFDYIYDNATNRYDYLNETFRMQIPVEVNESAISNFTATDLAYDNENASYSVSFNAVGLNNVRASLYSDCVSFADPLFSFGSLDGPVTLTSNALVNCESGNHEVVFTIASDELTEVVPLTLKVDKKALAEISAVPANSTLNEGTDYLRLNIANYGAVAGGLSVSVVGGGPITSSDVAYLGDFNGTTQAVFKVQSDAAGQYPLQVEANWNEGQESFSRTMPVEIDVDSPLSIPLAAVAVAAGAVALGAFALMRKRR